MKLLIIAMLIFPFGVTFAQEKEIDWHGDIEFLQKTINEDYPFLYKKVSREEFKTNVSSLLKELHTLNESQIKVRIAELIALFGYGHTVSWLTQWRYNEETDFHQLPINFYAFKDGIYIQGASRDYEDIAGAKVNKIGSVSIKKALDAIKPVVSVENDQFFMAHGINYLGVPEVLQARGVIENVNEISLTVVKNGKLIKKIIKPTKSFPFPGRYGLVQSNSKWIDARTSGEPPLWIRNLHKIYEYQHLKESNTLYVRQSQIQDDPNQKSIKDFYTEVFTLIEEKNIDRLILDLRLNSGGNNYKNKPLLLGLIKSSINKKGRLYVVLGRRTFSACQNLVNDIENYTNAIFVGEPTAENVNFFGDVNRIILPSSKFPIRLSYLWWQDKDPRDVRQWTMPQIPIKLSFNDYYNNNDPTIDIIIKSSDLELELKNLLEEGISANSIIQKIKVLINNGAHDFYDFENWINLAGYQKIEIENPKDAFELFKFNSELFPNSPNVWDSLAEGYWRTGNQSKAKELYQRVLKMAPGTRVAQHSQMMINHMTKNQ